MSDSSSSQVPAHGVPEREQEIRAAARRRVRTPLWNLLLIVPLLLTTLYAAADAAMIMWTALSSKELEHGGNTPNNLATHELFQLDTRLIKFSEALSYQDRIEKNHRRNEQIGVTINRGIKLACAAPLIYLVLVLATYFIAPSSFRP